MIDGLDLFAKTHFATITFSMNDWANIYASVACFKVKFAESGNEEIATQLAGILEKINDTLTT